ncbi:hypothetical protein N9N67_08580 [Bacteriovoracaceae bacterium]|nr:hypothetical protein [Bacteriovoracaceae bacterium]
MFCFWGQITLLNLWRVYLVLFSSLLTESYALEKIKIKLSDEVLAFSRKEFHRIKEKKLELVGNVVIMSGEETLYGEKATYDRKNNVVSMEGNVRFVSSQITIYGSRITSNLANQNMQIENARIITSEFTLVAEKLTKLTDTYFEADDAEFTTCKDCQESWTIFGKKIKLTLNKYIQIVNGLIRVKGVNILYIPYIALPIKNKRESGLLFPLVTSNQFEGLGYQQPIFVVTGDNSDITLTPTFWARRGYGTDIEYRHIFGEKKWFEFRQRAISDAIYYPLKNDFELSGKRYFRHFSEVESHYQWSNSINQHLFFSGAKDLDILQDQAIYTDNKILGSEVGLTTFLDMRTEHFNYGIEANYNRNVLVDNPEEFDRKYVQVLPHSYFNFSPYPIVQSDIFGLQNISLGMDLDHTVFRQGDIEEGIIRNATRINANPYLLWNFFNIGPIGFRSKYLLDYQEYKFDRYDEEADPFFKSSALLQTEASFSMDKIYGLAYQEERDTTDLSNAEFFKEENKEKGKLIGNLPPFQSDLTNETIKETRHSYRHSQEFKVIHHRITSDQVSGNEQFERQITSSEGWFDYIDSRRATEADIGANGSRQNVPVENTLEFQWNNSLIKKTPRTGSFYKDKKYLKDNFSYRRIGHINLSQGVILREDDEEQDEEISNNLTRLFFDSAYGSGPWIFSFQNYYFHDTSDQMLNFSVERRFPIISFLSRYSYNTLSNPDLQSATYGTQVRPLDWVGISFLQQMDLNVATILRSTVALDIMPNNNCWIFNLQYREDVNDQRYAFNFIFNFGDEVFDSYSRSFFNFGRL